MHVNSEGRCVLAYLYLTHYDQARLWTLTDMVQSVTMEASDELTANTNEVLNDGACGLPWMKVTAVEGKTESFWGFGLLGQEIDFLDLPRNAKGPLL